MSGCHDPRILDMGERLVKCSLCDHLQERINKLDEARIFHTNYVTKQSDVICSLEKKLSLLRMRVDNYIENIQEHDEKIHDIENIQAENRLHKLEKFMKEYENRMLALESAFDRLVKGAILHTQLTESRLKSTHKNPHKCPVCEGEGLDKNKLVMEDIKDLSNVCMKNPPCHACEGKGVIWG